MSMAKQLVSHVKVHVIEILVCQAMDGSCYEASEAGKDLCTVKRIRRDAIKGAKMQVLSELQLNAGNEEIYVRFTVTEVSARVFHEMPAT